MCTMATALVTGGTSGIGAAFARAAGGPRRRPGAGGPQRRRLAEAAAELTSATASRWRRHRRPRASRRRAPGRRPARPSADQPIDLLVNNAGLRRPGKLTSEDIASARARHRRDDPRGADPGGGRRPGHAGARLAARSSTSPAPPASSTMGSYSAIKAWVTAYSEGLANELTRHRRHGDRAVPGLGADRVPRAGRDPHRLDPGVAVAGRRTTLVAEAPGRRRPPAR